MTQKTLANNLEDLPKWAQHEIKVLQMRLREAKDELTRINDNPKSNTIIGNDYEFQGAKTKYLKDNQDITFILKKGNVNVKISNECIEIYSMGGGDFFIRPKVSNSIEIHLK